jgi:integrase
MGWSEQRGNFWRARWKAPNGKIESMSGFLTEKAADTYWQDQEAAIRAQRYVDPRAGQILFEEWANLWFRALDLEPSTMANYRYQFEHNILPFFQGRSLAAIAREEVTAWEKDLVRVHGKSPRTAKDARVTLASCLSAAMPHRIQFNPAAKEKARGRRGLRRVEKAQAKQRSKDVPTPLEVLLYAERIAILSGQDDDLARELLYAFGGVRWSEALALGPDYLTEDGALDVVEKLFELEGKFYRGIPKDGSLRQVDLPPLLMDLLADMKPRRCTCKPRTRLPGDPQWCQGGEYLILGPGGGHPRRSNASRRFVRPAADGWWPGLGGAQPRPAMPVLVDLSRGWPGVPVNPWPAAGKGAFTPPRIVERGRAHKVLSPDTPIATWLPIRQGLTTHWLRHAQQTWMAEDRIPDIMRDERMGHQVQDESRIKAAMRDHYTHTTERMRADVVATQQQRLETALMQRAELERHWAEAGLPRRSPVALLDRLLEPYRQKTVSSLSTPLTPRLGGRRRPVRLTARGAAHAG